LGSSIKNIVKNAITLNLSK